MFKVRAKQAFTMFEMLAVIALIGVIMAFVLPRVQQWMGKSGEADIKFRMTEIKEALALYKMEFGVFPTTREGLRALISNPRPNVEHFKKNEDKWPFIREERIMDRAGNEFVYHCPPERFKNKYKHYEVLYLGPTQSPDDPDAKDDGE
jgi:general secretion pathway protein G